MKKIILTLTLLITFQLSAQEDIFSYNYRSVPAEELESFFENEVVYWTGIHSILIKKGQSTGWAMLQRVGGKSSDPNIYFYMGHGSYENLDNLNKNWQVAEAEYRKSMDSEKLALIDKQLNIHKRIVGEVLLNRVTSANLEGGMSDWNYLVHNYAKAKKRIYNKYFYLCYF